MPEVNIVPYPKQIEYFLATSRHIGYGGSRGGGKSWAARSKAVLLALNYEGIQILLLRRTLQELRENHVLPLLIQLKNIAKYNAEAKEFIFPNGSRIKLGYCAAESDVLQFQGQAYDVIFIEEATQFTEFQRDALIEINRSSGMMKVKFTPRIYYTANPGGVGHAWFKRLFITRNYKNKEKSEHYTFVPSTVYENEYLMTNNPEYVENLENLPEMRRRAMLDGDWDCFAGQAFGEWINNRAGYKTRIGTHVISPFIIPLHWRIYRSFDFGYSKPFSVGWWAVDTEGTCYRIKELYGGTGEPNVGLKWHPKQIAQKIADIEDDYWPNVQIHGVADPSIWDGSRGESVAEQMENVKRLNGHRITFEPGDNKRLPGKMQLHYRLAFDVNMIPMMYVFTTCTEFIRTFPELIYDDKHVEDIDTDGEDHAYDEARYFLMTKPIKAKEPVVAKPKMIDPFTNYNEPQGTGKSFLTM